MNPGEEKARRLGSPPSRLPTTAERLAAEGRCSARARWSSPTDSRVARLSATHSAWKPLRKGGPGFWYEGKSYKELGLLEKRIKVDQALAEELWDTGNHDARILATKVADPNELDRATIDS